MLKILKDDKNDFTLKGVSTYFQVKNERNIESIKKTKASSAEYESCL